MQLNKRGPRCKALLVEYEHWKAQYPELTQRDFAAQQGISTSDLLNRLHAARHLEKIGLLEIPEPLQVKTFDRAFNLEGDFMIVGDAHVPYTDWDLAALVSAVARKHLKKPRRMILAGDFFSMDYFSTYAQIVISPTWKRERDAARALLELWFKTFDEIYGLMGNHERRLQRFTAGAFDETDIAALVFSNPDKLKWSDYGWCVVNSIWRITHPKNYSRLNLRVAEDLAMKYRQNIISHHEHHAGMGFDRYGNHVIVNNGCLLEQSKLSYASLDDNTSPAMIKAFCMLKGNHPYLFCDNGLPFTDWDYWLGKV